MSDQQPHALISAEALLAMEFSDVQWVIQGILPEGTTILAGRPKTGKSWLALQMAIAVASMNNPIDFLDTGHILTRPVIYLALEDGPRRLHRRLKKILPPLPGANPSPPCIEFATSWPRAGNGGIKLLADQLEMYQDYGPVVIIDTLSKFRDKRISNNDIYSDDYEALSAIKEMLDNKKANGVIITHTRKPSRSGDEEDFLDEVIGSTGLTGSPDTTIVLKRPRNNNEGKLYITGRDVEEHEMALLWNPQTCLWSHVPAPEGYDADPDHGLPADWKLLRQILKNNGGAMGPLEILAMFNQNGKTTKTYNAIKLQLKRMLEEGQVTKAGDGLYCHPDKADSLN